MAGASGLLGTAPAVLLLPTLLPTLLLAGCGGGADARPTPGSVAEQWATDVLLRSGAGASALQCRPGLESLLDPERLTLGAVTGVTATSTKQVSGSRWQVRLRTVPDGTTFPVTVVEQHGEPVVCE